MIKGFKDRVTEAVDQGESPKGFPADIVKVARRKLVYLDAAIDLNDLRSPPGNRLEALSRVSRVLHLDRGRAERRRDHRLPLALNDHK